MFSLGWEWGAVQKVSENKVRKKKGWKKKVHVLFSAIKTMVYRALDI